MFLPHGTFSLLFCYRLAIDRSSVNDLPRCCCCVPPPLRACRSRRRSTPQLKPPTKPREDPPTETSREVIFVFCIFRRGEKRRSRAVAVARGYSDAFDNSFEVASLCSSARLSCALSLRHLFSISCATSFSRRSDFDTFERSGEAHSFSQQF